MPEIPYQQFQNYLREMDTGAVPPVYLLFGEEYLYKSVQSSLIERICPDKGGGFDQEVLDGNSTNVFRVLESMATYPFLSQRKIVAFADAKIFYSSQDKGKWLENAKAAYQQKDIAKAARNLLRFLASLNLKLNEADPDSLQEALKTDSGEGELEAWLEETIAFARNQNLSVPDAPDEAGVLEKAIEKGFPKGNLLIITTDLVDKRRKVYQSIKQAGVIVDCSMPKGNRQADRQAQEALLQETVRERLDGSGKRMDKAAYAALAELTGADPRLFAGNIDTLVSYVGDRQMITADDVRAVLRRTRQDPIFELTGAFSDRELSKALICLDSLLADGFHPLQLLSALAKQIRKLIVVKDFTESRHGRAWQKDMSFSQFKAAVLPAMERFDAELSVMGDDREDALPPEGKKADKRSKKKGEADTGIGANPNNPYPVYLLVRKSGNFSLAELVDGLRNLHAADLRMKSSAQSPRLILENALTRIMGNPPKRSLT
ncbi:MAG: DNA polymerase III subunit delta [Thermodesulfobacteriota bacterium]